MVNSNSRCKDRGVAGFTLVETLAVVGIVIILAAVAFVSVIQARISLRQKELDETAKAIYFSAQNHLTAADDQGLVKNLLGETRAGSVNTAVLGAQSVVRWTNDPSNSTYFFAYHPGTSTSDVNSPTNNATSILGLMLPTGAIDDYVRTSGSYVIRYDYKTCRILDVFFTDSTTPADYFSSDVYADLMTNYRGAEKKDARRGYRGVFGNVIGYFDGDNADTSGKETLEPALVRVTNGDVLKVTIKNPNTWESGLRLVMVVKGKESGAEKAFRLDAATEHVQVESGNQRYVVTLDNVVETDVDGEVTENGRFYEVMQGATGSFVPGEDLQIYVEAFYTNKLSNVARSIVYTTNSLFANGSAKNVAEDPTGKQYDARIASMRHLINLEGREGEGSRLQGYKASDKSQYPYDQINATQLTDLSWSKFAHNTEYETSEEVAGKTVYTPKPLKSVQPRAELGYDGNNKKISGVIVNAATEGAGLFKTLEQNSSIEDLTLSNFTITSGAGAAGMLVGSIPAATKDSDEGVRISNVLAYDGTGTQSVVTGATHAGGLVGTIAGTGNRESATITNSAAAVIVSATSASGVAGGLVGGATNATITNSYAGGHTTNGKYVAASPNVSAAGDTGVAGGLIGTLSNTVVSNCYTTCSVKGNMAGGFVGTSQNSDVINSYATGLVSDRGESTDDNDETTSTLGAFAASFAGKKAEGLKGDLYLSIINNDMQSVPKLDANGKPEATEGITKIDESAATYDAFYQGTATAVPYDSSLASAYNGKYPYKTVNQLSATATGSVATTHYGDWPSPETLVYNSKS